MAVAHVAHSLWRHIFGGREKDKMGDVRRHGSSSTAVALILAMLASALVIVAGSPASAATTDLEITELLASNSTGLQDEDLDFSDWIEIHNAGVDAVDMAGLSLTDDATNPIKWVLPSVVVPADGYLVVFASSKNRVDPASELHTNFGLGAGGEYLGLYDTDGTTVLSEYSPGFPAQSADRSYGIDSNGDIRFFSTPTPGVANGVGDLPVAEVVTADVDRGFYDAPFSVTLTTAQAGGEIRFTTDGSEPTATTGTVYTSPVAVSTTTVLRAATFAPGFLPSATSTYSYVFLGDVINQPATIPGFPNGRMRPTGNAGSVPLDMAMDPDVVSAYSSEILDSMKAIPTLSMTASVDDIFGPGGFYFSDNVEHGTSIEVLDAADPSANDQIDVGVESHSHDRLKRSLRLNFRADYGSNEWVTNLLQDGPLNGDSATDTHRTLILRGGNNRSWARSWNPDATAYTIDELYRESQIAMTGIGSHGTFVHLYLNGAYWGVYNLVERPDDEYQAQYFGGSDNDWFFTNHGGAGSADSTRWDYLTGALTDKDMSVPANYAEMQQYLDVQNFADYVLLSFWMGMTDWPTNNWYVANRNASSPLGATPTQFFAWDGEWSLDRKLGGGPAGADIPAAFLNDTGSSVPIVKIWHALLDSPDFRTLLADRVALHTAPGGALTDSAAIARWDALNAYVQSAIVGESARWGDSLETLGSGGPINYTITRTRDVDWQNEVDAIRTLLQGNQQRLIGELVAAGLYTDLSAPTFSPNGGNVAAGSTATITNPNASGSIVYTLDGSDPRTPANPSAIAYAGPITISNSVVITAAVVDGSVSSAATSASFQVPTLAITEMHYHPANPTPDEALAGFSSADDFEFIELQNVSDSTLDLSNLFFTTGITANPAAQDIAPGEVVVLVANQAAFELRYGTNPQVVGVYSGSLSNGGEQIVAQYPAGFTIADYTYDDAAPWPTSPDGGGPSLEVIDPSASLNSAANWQASAIDGGTPGVLSVEPAVPGTAQVTITPSSSIGASTYGNSTFTIANTGAVGDANITKVEFDLRGSLIPDATFDPLGTAGDTTENCLDVSSAGGTGYVVPADKCINPFTLPHEDSPGVAGNGNDGMTLDFTDFGPGESIVFGVDIDPTTIQGVVGSGGAGSISGLELTGSTVRVTFSDGTVRTNQLFGDGSAGGAKSVVSSSVGLVTPTGIEMVGVSTSPTVFPNNSRVGTVPATGARTVRVSGPVGASVKLLAVTGDLVTNPAFDVDPFESDSAVAVSYLTGTTGAGGTVDFAVNVANPDVLYHYVATIDDGANGLLTSQLLIGVGEVLGAPTIDPIANVTVAAGDTVNVAITANDPDSDPLDLGIQSTPDIVALGATLDDNGDGTGSLSWATDTPDIGSYSVQISASDGTTTTVEAFVITVTDPDAIVLYRVNAGGPSVAASDGGPAWSEDRAHRWQHDRFSDGGDTFAVLRVRNRQDVRFE